MKITKLGREELRHRFEAQTDIEVDPVPADWERYAEWLETLDIKQIDKETLKENEMLRHKIRKAISVLEKGITGAFAPRSGAKTLRERAER